MCGPLGLCCSQHPKCLSVLKNRARFARGSLRPRTWEWAERAAHTDTTPGVPHAGTRTARHPAVRRRSRTSSHSAKARHNTQTNRRQCVRRSGPRRSLYGCMAACKHAPAIDVGWRDVGVWKNQLMAGQSTTTTREPAAVWRSPPPLAVWAGTWGGRSGHMRHPAAVAKTPTGGAERAATAPKHSAKAETTHRTTDGSACVRLLATAPRRRQLAPRALSAAPVRCAPQRQAEMSSSPTRLGLRLDRPLSPGILN